MATTLEQVRAVTGLTTTELSDDQIATFLELNGDSVKLAAADALEAFAGTLTSIDSDDMRIDDTKRATVLMARAKVLREQAGADADDDAFTFDVVFPGGCRPELTPPEVCW